MLVHDFLQRSAERYGNKVAVVAGKDRVTYSELYGYAEKISRWLIDQGVTAGERIAILTDQPVHYISSYFGILMAGGIVVGLNTQTSERSLETAVNDCTPSVVLLSGRSKKYRSFLAGFASIKNVADIGEIYCDVNDNRGERGTPTAAIEPASIAQIIYTSGTTGKPKGVMLRHTNLVANSLSTIEYLGLSSNDSVMAVLPFFYSYGNSILLTHIGVGGTLVVNQSFVYPNVILNQMVEEKVTGLSGVPSTFAILLHRSAIADYTFPHLRYLTQAGAAMSPALAEQLQNVFPEIDIYIMYGQTEAAPRLSYLPPEDVMGKPGSIGKAIPGVTLEVLQEDGAQSSPRQTGEIVASGENIMAGYWQRPEETQAALRDGKLWTGDLAYYDEDGYLYIVSRKSEMIKCGSHRIAPKEIEEMIMERDGVSEVAVVGVPDQILGEVIHAYVVLQADAVVSEKDIIKYCRRNLPAFKVPHKILFLEELPRSESGKINKGLLHNDKVND